MTSLLQFNKYLAIASLMHFFVWGGYPESPNSMFMSITWIFNLLRSSFSFCLASVKAVQYNRWWCMSSTSPELHWIHKSVSDFFMPLRYLFNPTFPSLNLVSITSMNLFACLHQSQCPSLSLTFPKNVSCLSKSQKVCHLTAWRLFTCLCRSTNPAFTRAWK